MALALLAVGASIILILALTLRSRRALVTAGASLLPLPIIGWAVVTTGQAGHDEAAGAGSTPTHVPAAGTSAPEASSPVPADLLGPALDRARRVPGVEWPDPGQRYTPQTISKRINGAAELYRRHGLRGAIFATARAGGADIEVQLYDQGGRPGGSASLWAEVTGGAGGRPLPGAGDAAVLWEGGGELREGDLYARVVLAAADPSPEADAAAERILRALAGAAEPDRPLPAAREGRAPAPAPCPPSTEPSPASAGPAGEAAPGIADRLDTTVQAVEQYGILSVEHEELPGGFARMVRLRDVFSAAAWAVSIRPQGARAGEAFGFSTASEAAAVRGAVVLWVKGPGAEERLVALSARHPAAGVPGSELLAGATTMDVLLSGWGGKRALGPTLVGRFGDAGIEVFVAFPEMPEEAMSGLVAGLEKVEGPDPDGLVAGTDPYQGEVALVRKEGMVVGCAGAPDRDGATKRLQEALAGRHGAK